MGNNRKAQKYTKMNMGIKMLEEQFQLMQDKMKQNNQTSATLRLSDRKVNTSTMRTRNRKATTKEQRMEWHVLLKMLTSVNDENEWPKKINKANNKQRSIDIRVKDKPLGVKIKKVRKLHTIFEKKRRRVQKVGYIERGVMNYFSPHINEKTKKRKTFESQIKGEGIVENKDNPIVPSDIEESNSKENTKIQTDENEGVMQNDWKFLILEEENALTRAMIKRPDLFYKVKKNYFKAFNIQEENFFKPELMVCDNMIIEYLISRDEVDEVRMNKAKDVLMEYVDNNFHGNINEMKDYIQYYTFMYNMSRQICLKYGI